MMKEKIELPFCTLYRTMVFTKAFQFEVSIKEYVTKTVEKR